MSDFEQEDQIMEERRERYLLKKHKDEVEECPYCASLMIFQRDNEKQPHEYDVCTACGKHLCIKCSKHDDDDNDYCPECYELFQAKDVLETAVVGG
jgi:hypothetical protein